MSTRKSEGEDFAFVSRLFFSYPIANTEASNRMMSAGFHWGQAPVKELPRQIPENYTQKPMMKKRKYEEDEEEPERGQQDQEEGEKQHQQQHNQQEQQLQQENNRNQDDQRQKFKHFKVSRKKIKTEKILGQQLPVPRLIEVLDQKGLQNLVAELLNIHPEIENTIHNISKQPTLQDSINLLQEKFQQIRKNLPYKYDIESDYSYLRVKPDILEFLNCTSDFILNFVPPIENNIFNSLNFLKFITEILNDLPKFTSSEFNYIISTAYEQIANTWLICLTIKEENTNIESLTNLIKIVEQLDLLTKLNQFNHQSNGKFIHVLQYLQSQIDQFDQMNSIGSSPTRLCDLIQVDYLNYSMIARTSH